MTDVTPVTPTSPVVEVTPIPVVPVPPVVVIEAKAKRDTKMLKALAIVSVAAILIFAPIWLLVGAKDPDRCEFIPAPTTTALIVQIPVTDP